MARVLKKPPKNFNSPLEKKVQCKSCGATIGYHENEIKARHGTDISGGPDGEEWITCAHCHKRIILRSW